MNRRAAPPLHRRAHRRHAATHLQQARRPARVMTHTDAPRKVIGEVIGVRLAHHRQRLVGARTAAELEAALATLRRDPDARAIMHNAQRAAVRRLRTLP